MEIFLEIANSLQPLSISTKKLDHICSNWFQIPLCQGQWKNLRTVFEEVKWKNKSVCSKSKIKTKHIKNFLLRIHELSRRESTLERFWSINDARFGNGDLKINIDINCFLLIPFPLIIVTISVLATTCKKEMRHPKRNLTHRT